MILGLEDPPSVVRGRQMIAATDFIPIGELARRTGSSVSAIRFYEDKGLLDSLRSAGGQRRFLGGPEQHSAHEQGDRVRRTRQPEPPLEGERRAQHLFAHERVPSGLLSYPRRGRPRNPRRSHRCRSARC